MHMHLDALLRVRVSCGQVKSVQSVRLEYEDVLRQHPHIDLAQVPGCARGPSSPASSGSDAPAIIRQARATPSNSSRWHVMHGIRTLCQHSQVAAARTMSEFDNFAIAPMFGCACATDYYREASAGNYLSRVMRRAA